MFWIGHEMYAQHGRSDRTRNAYEGGAVDASVDSGVEEVAVSVREVSEAVVDICVAVEDEAGSEVEVGRASVVVGPGLFWDEDAAVGPVEAPVSEAGCEDMQCQAGRASWVGERGRRETR